MLSGEMVKLSLAQLPFERLAVPAQLALDMFQDNRYKSVQVPSIANQSKLHYLALINKCSKVWCYCE